MPTAEPLFTAAARRHAARLAKAIAPMAGRLERASRAVLKRRGCEPSLCREYLAIAPVAAARQKSLNRFLEEVECQGKRLAKQNVAPAEVRSVLREMEALLDPVLGDRFAPSREQLHLATVLALDRAYYQVREAEAQALFGIYQAEAEAADGDDLLRRVAAVLVKTFQAGAGEVLATRQLDRPLRRPLFIEGGTPKERLIADERMRGRYVCYWSIPLDATAVVQLGFSSRVHWLAREGRLLEMAAERCRGALERARLQAEVHRLEVAARQAEEQERRRIGRELHDETGQSLLVLRLQLEMMEREARGPAAERLREARTMVEHTVVELRRLIAALSPSVLERLGMQSALRHLVGRFRQTHAADVRVRIAGPVKTLPRPVQELIYRIAQECLQNVTKHSQASAVNLSLTVADKTIRLKVADNGAGLRAGAASSNPISFGLTGMRDRAALLGGTLTARGAPGKGTTVILEVPRKSAMVTENVENSSTVD